MASDGFRWLPMAAECFRLLPIASDCFRWLPMAADCFRLLPTASDAGELGHADWSFDFIKKASYMLSHGAHLVLTAEDAFNPSADPDYPTQLWPLPGPGMFGAMFRKLMEPLDHKYVHVCGKGGAEGQRYMMTRAIEMLRAQGHSGDASSILIVGDRYDTDIRAGVQAGIKTCLVESGCHTAGLQPLFAHDRAHYVAASIKELIPHQCVRATIGTDVRRHERISHDAAASHSSRQPGISSLQPAARQRASDRAALFSLSAAGDDKVGGDGSPMLPLRAEAVAVQPSSPSPPTPTVRMSAGSQAGLGDARPSSTQRASAAFELPTGGGASPSGDAYDATRRSSSATSESTAAAAAARSERDAAAVGAAAGEGLLPPRPSSVEMTPTETLQPPIARVSSLPMMTSERDTASLRSWMLTHSNLVYAGGAVSGREPLVPLLRRYFDEHGSNAGTGRISSVAARTALASLGLLPGSTLEPSWASRSWSHPHAQHGASPCASPWAAPASEATTPSASAAADDSPRASFSGLARFKTVPSGLTPSSPVATAQALTPPTPASAQHGASELAAEQSPPPGVTFATLLTLVQRKFEALGQPHALFGSLAPPGSSSSHPPPAAKGERSSLEGGERSTRVASGACKPERSHAASSAERSEGEPSKLDSKRRSTLSSLHDLQAAQSEASEGSGSRPGLRRSLGTKSELDIAALDRSWQLSACTSQQHVSPPTAERIVRDEPSSSAAPATIADALSEGRLPATTSSMRPNMRSMPNLESFFQQQM